MNFDFVVIGSGFGGSVSALRLAEKGYSVAVLEKGKRYKSEDFPKTNWNIRKFLWAPMLKCFGIQKITLFRNVFVLSGVGVGGGSLVYANTLMQPKSSVFKDPVWSSLNDWEATLAPHYKTARFMLGTTPNTFFGKGDQILKQVGYDLGCESTFSTVDVGVYFGDPDKDVSDPYFGGKGPNRRGCNYCGGCMVGCRFNAKNTLDKNYLYLAEKKGVQIIPETKATRITPQSDGSYKIETRTSTAWLGFPRHTYTARKIIFAAGALGSVQLLLENKIRYKTLPKISDHLGCTVRTNGESLVGATALDTSPNLSKGLAITSAIHPDEVTKIEVVRYSKGSDFMRLLTAPLVGPGSNFTRPIKTVFEILRSWKKVLRLWAHKDWANSTIILLVMQAVDNQISLGMPRRWWRLFRKGFGAININENKIDAYIPIAEKAALSASQALQGIPQMAFSEALLNAPATAHILGGAKIGSTYNDGVVDKWGRLFNYPDLYVVDGSIIPANLGVNPSLTITALAEYIQSHIPNKQ